MPDLQLYQQLLGLTGPWAVGPVTLPRAAPELEVEVRGLETVWGGPTCGQQRQGHGQEARRGRLLARCQCQPSVVCAGPRVRGLEPGSQQVAGPWAAPRGRCPRRFERHALAVRRECSVLGAGALLESWSAAEGSQPRAVVRGLARPPARAPVRLCVDGQSAGRKREPLAAYGQSRTPEPRTGVAAGGRDLWEPFFNSPLAPGPGTADKIVPAPFHLVSYRNAARHDLHAARHEGRPAEPRGWLAAGKRPVRGRKQLGLEGAEKLPANRAAALARRKGQPLPTRRAWALKELFRDFWDGASVAAGRGDFRRW